MNQALVRLARASEHTTTAVRTFTVFLPSPILFVPSMYQVKFCQTSYNEKFSKILEEFGSSASKRSRSETYACSMLAAA